MLLSHATPTLSNTVLEAAAAAAAATAQTKPQPVATHTLIIRIAPRIHLQLSPGHARMPPLLTCDGLQLH